MVLVGVTIAGTFYFKCWPLSPPPEFSTVIGHCIRNLILPLFRVHLQGFRELRLHIPRFCKVNTVNRLSACFNVEFQYQTNFLDGRVR